MKLGIKIDVDTYKGTQAGVPNFARLLKKHCAPATFLFSLGPDNTGKSLSRIFQKGFVKKCLRSNVAGNYGLKTLMYGSILPAPVISKKCPDIMRSVRDSGFECGVHSWDHYKWQNRLFKMRDTEVEAEFMKACAEFEKIMGFAPKTCGAPGWQISSAAIEAEDKAEMLYASDCRGKYPFFPKIGGRVFKTLQIPTTLPTLDELLGRIPMEKVSDVYLKEMEKAEFSVMTVHAELEGMKYMEWFDNFLTKVSELKIELFSLEALARNILEKGNVPSNEISMEPFEGRSGLLAVQKC